MLSTVGSVRQLLPISCHLSPYVLFFRFSKIPLRLSYQLRPSRCLCVASFLHLLQPGLFVYRFHCYYDRVDILKIGKQNIGRLNVVIPARDKGCVVLIITHFVFISGTQKFRGVAVLPKVVRHNERGQFGKQYPPPLRCVYRNLCINIIVVQVK